jgi:hypothetical protein
VSDFVTTRLVVVYYDMNDERDQSFKDKEKRKFERRYYKCYLVKHKIDLIVSRVRRQSFCQGNIDSESLEMSWYLCNTRRFTRRSK